MIFHLGAFSPTLFFSRAMIGSFDPIECIMAIVVSIGLAYYAVAKDYVKLGFSSDYRG